MRGGRYADVGIANKTKERKHRRIMYAFFNNVNVTDTVKSYAKTHFGAEDDRTIKKNLHFYVLVIQPESGGAGFIKVFNEKPINTPDKAKAAIMGLSEKGAFRDLTTAFRFTFNEITWDQFQAKTKLKTR